MREQADITAPSAKPEERLLLLTDGKLVLTADAVRILSARPEQPRMVTSQKGRHRLRGGTLRWANVLRRDPCAYCGQPASTVDHIDPDDVYGRRTWENLIGCCAQCNREKDRTPLLLFLQARRSICEQVS